MNDKADGVAACEGALGNLDELNGIMLDCRNLAINTSLIILNRAGVC